MSDRCFYPTGNPVIQRDRLPELSREAARALNRPYWAHVWVRVHQRGTETQDGREYRTRVLLTSWREELDGTGITQW